MLNNNSFLHKQAQILWVLRTRWDTEATEGQLRSVWQICACAKISLSDSDQVWSSGFYSSCGKYHCKCLCRYNSIKSPGEGSRRLACQSRTQSLWVGPWRTHAWWFQCQRGCAQWFGNWEDRRASRTQFEHHLSGQQTDPWACGPPGGDYVMEVGRWVGKQTSGPKAKLLTKTIVEDEMVGRCSGLRKSPWNSLYGEYFLPYLKQTKSAANTIKSASFCITSPSSA